MRSAGQRPSICVSPRDTLRYVENKPYSLRLGSRTLRRLAEEAGRRRMPGRTLAQELVDEGLRMRRHPSITFIDRASGRYASLARRPRLKVADIVETVRASADRSDAAEYLDLAPGEVDRVLDYYAEFKDEIDEEIRQSQEVADREERLYRERERLSAAPPR